MGITSKLAKYNHEAYRLGHFPSLRSLFTGKKIYAYYGYLGDGNFGDELVYESAKQLFEPNILLPVKRFMPLHLAAFAHACKGRFSGAVIGGGTLIGASLYLGSFFEDLIELNKPVYLHGTGVSNLSAWNAGWKRLLAGRLYGGVRGPLSAGNVAEFKEGIRVAGDAAFLLFREEDATSSAAERKSILINFGTHFGYDKEEESRSAVCEFVAASIEQGADVRFMPCHWVDVDLGLELQQSYPSITLLDIPRTYAEACTHFRKAAFAIGERLHFTAMAVMSGCPFLSVNYATKHQDMLSSVGLFGSGVMPKELSAAKIQAAFEARGSFDWDSVFHRIAELKWYQEKEAAAFSAL